MAPTISIGANIYKLRKEARLTQDDLASYLGVTKASVSKWETGQSYPDIELLPRIATYFGISVDALMGYEPQLSKSDIGTNAPSDDALIKKNMVEGVAANPAFAALADEPRFKLVVKSLWEIAR